MLNATTSREQEHEERNLRQCVALWRACGDSDHDILGELLLRGHDKAEAERLMAPVVAVPGEQCLTDQRLVDLLAQIVTQMVEIRDEMHMLRQELRRSIN